MKESQLKKEFDSKAVNRVRNLVKKDFTSKTTIGTGYSKKREKHSESDIWEEDGRTWTIKNGVKQNITKLDKAKKTLQVPLTCPKCGGSMRHHLAKKMYKIHGFCFDCTIDMEADLRRAGLYEQYEKQMMSGSIDAWIAGLEQWMQEELTKTMTFVTEEGDVEDWKGNNSKHNARIMKNISEYVEQLKKHIE
jgi:bacterioferritin-associated ferredoxin